MAEEDSEPKDDLDLDLDPDFDVMKDFQTGNDVRMEDILQELLNGDRDLDLKSEIHNPRALASLNVFALASKEVGFLESDNYLREYIRVYLRYMFSNNRKSRSEIIDAITAENVRKKMETTFTEKITKDLTK